MTGGTVLSGICTLSFWPRWIRVCSCNSAIFAALSRCGVGFGVAVVERVGAGLGVGDGLGVDLLDLSRGLVLGVLLFAAEAFVVGTLETDSDRVCFDVRFLLVVDGPETGAMLDDRGGYCSEFVGKLCFLGGKKCGLRRSESAGSG
jgi:hypothetical protein